MVAELFPQLAIMDEGQIVVQGPTDQILADRDLLVRHGLEGMKG